MWNFTLDPSPSQLNCTLFLIERSGHPSCAYTQQFFCSTVHRFGGKGDELSKQRRGAPRSAVLRLNEFAFRKSVMVMFAECPVKRAASKPQPPVPSEGNVLIMECLALNFVERSRTPSVSVLVPPRVRHRCGDSYEQLLYDDRKSSPTVRNRRFVPSFGRSFFRRSWRDKGHWSVGSKFFVNNVDAGAVCILRRDNGKQ